MRPLVGSMVKATYPSYGTALPFARLPAGAASWGRAHEAEALDLGEDPLVGEISCIHGSIVPKRLA